jgi:membrane-bound metal-dependent hydrolase YbcI (DUF457 family)
MGNYRQHITLASFLGVVYAWGAAVGVGIHWLYGSVAALLTALGGLLPDLDSDSGVELKGFTGLLGVLAAVAVWQGVAQHEPGIPFELHLLVTIGCFILVRHGLRRIMSRLTVHRGISHSLPACAVWGALTYLNYPSPFHLIRLTMAAAVVLGFLSHLLLDELCSVDLRGARVNKAFGSALKFWAPSPWSTLGIYVLLSYLAWLVIQQWPDPPFDLGVTIPPPTVSIPLPRLPLPPPPAGG